ncbi:unnamed protein product [Calypogeia fissa]
MASPRDGGHSVLKALDSAKTQTYHFKAIVIAGMGFFTDAYDLFVIGTLQKLIGRIYYYDPTFTPASPGFLPPNVLAAVTGVALCGTLAGQLFFGWAGDKWGRKASYGVTLALMIVASLGQGLSIGFSATSVISTLCFFRFWLGFGIGGDYPLSATIMSEYANKKTRGSFVAAVFAMQGVGYLVAAAVTIIITSIFRNSYPRQAFDVYQSANPGQLTDPSVPRQADWVWRLVLMFGAVPAALTFYSRSHMPETPRYTALIQHNQEQTALDMEKVLNTSFDATHVAIPEAAAPKTQYGLFSREFARRHGVQLIGTCSTWFLLDVSYYSQNLFQPKMFQASGWVEPATKMSALEETFKNARAQAYIALAGTVPGYWFTVAFIDVVGRKPIQLMGFFMMSVFMYILAFDFYKLRGVPDSTTKTGYRHGNHVAFIVLYGFTFFFSNFGPNATTFIVPAELFPARVRSTCHGISSAFGKAGSIIGTFGFLYASQDDTHGSHPDPKYKKGIGYEYSFLLLAICSTMGFFCTLFFVPETKGRSLEDLSGEDEDAGVTDGYVDEKAADDHEKPADGHNNAAGHNNGTVTA